MTKCGQCGRSGHNRRVCPSRKRKAPSGGGEGKNGRPARGGKSAKRPRHGGGGAGLHDPFRAARAAVAQADAAVAKHKAAYEAGLVPLEKRLADARAALARAEAEADDPGDFPCFPAAVRNGRRFPWSIALQFAAARDLAAGLASTHHAAREVCRHEQTAKRIIKARHGRGCKRARDTECKCGGCARVALLLRAADTLGTMEKRPTAGDRVVLKEGETMSGYGFDQDVLRPGEVGTIVRDDHGITPYEVRGPRGDDTTWFQRRQVVSPNIKEDHASWTGPSRWLRVLDYTEGAAAGRLAVRQFGVTGRGVCVDPARGGHIYVANTEQCRIDVYAKEGVRVRTIGNGARGTGNDQFHMPYGVCVEPGPEGRLYVADYRNHRVQVLTKMGEHVRTFGVTGQRGEGNHQFDTPVGVCVEPGADGHVYVSEHVNYRIKVLTKGGQFVRHIGTGRGSGNDQFGCPRGVAVDSNSIFVGDEFNHRVQVFAKDDGHYVRTIGTTAQQGSGNHQLSYPFGLCVEPGPGGRLFVADALNHRVQVLTKDGQYVRTLGVTGQAGNGNHQFNQPFGVCVESGPSGRVFVLERENRRVVVFLK